MKLILIEERDNKLISEKAFEDVVIKVGRDYPGTDCQLLFDSEDWPMVSRRHAEFRLQDGHWFVVDTKSAFGTLVEGETITAPTEIHEGMRIQFGEEGPTLLVRSILSISEAEEDEDSDFDTLSLLGLANTRVGKEEAEEINKRFENGPLILENIPPTEPPLTEAEEPAFVQIVDEVTEELHRYQITKNVMSIGRDRDVDIRFDASLVVISRKHAEIRRQGSNYFLVDSKSFNGTLLNDKPVTPEQPTRLSDGDHIQLGTKGPVLLFRNPAYQLKK